MFTARRLTEVRNALGLSTLEMASLLGVPVGTWGRWEKGCGGPRGVAYEVCLAVDVAMRRGIDAWDAIKDETDHGRRLWLIFRNAYG